jgi:uncharacterized protein YoxC
MPTNREILYTIRMRNAASAAIRQLSADMKAQGTTLKEVARQVQAVTTELGKVEGIVTKTDKAMSGMAATASRIDKAASAIARFAASIAGLASNSRTFTTLAKAVGKLDGAFSQARGSAYASRLSALTTALAALQTQFHATQSAAAGLVGIAPPAAPRGSGGGRAGASPNGTAPPRAANPTGNGSNANANQAFNKSLDETKSRLSDIQGQLARYAGLVTAAFGARQVLGMADEYGQLQGALKLVTRDAANLKEVYGSLFDTANNVGQSLGGTVQIFSRLTSAGESLGLTQRQLVETTDAINKSVAIFGGSAASSEAAIVQLAQGLASNALRGEELNSVLEQTPPGQGHRRRLQGCGGQRRRSGGRPAQARRGTRRDDGPENHAVGNQPAPLRRHAGRSEEVENAAALDVASCIR